MVEVAIASVEAVFDWKDYFKKTFDYTVDEDPESETEESRDNEL